MRGLAILIALAMLMQSCDGWDDGLAHDDVVQVCVINENGWQCGTGFFLFEPGILFTAHHVVEISQSQGDIFVLTKDKINVVYQSGTHGVVAENIQHDIVILGLDPGDSPELFLTPCSGTSLGDAITIVGFPSPGLIEKETTGFVIDYSDDGIYIMTDAEVYWGYSGGPIINDTRNCIAGMTTQMWLENFEGFGPSILALAEVYGQLSKTIWNE